jgi:hypothetical protein
VRRIEHAQTREDAEPHALNCRALPERERARVSGRAVTRGGRGTRRTDCRAQRTPDSAVAARTTTRATTARSTHSLRCSLVVCAAALRECDERVCCDQSQSNLIVAMRCFRIQASRCSLMLARRRP